MGLKNLLFAATLASSSLASASDAVHSSVVHAKGDTSQKLHDSLGHDNHKLHPHVEIFAGVEQNHLLDHGQFMKDEFSSLSIHGSLGNWGAYYHWLQAKENSLEHKAGVVYSYPLNDSVTLRTGVSGVYEVAGSEHETVHPVVSEESDSQDSHKESTHHDSPKHEPVLESTFYAAISAEIEGILSQSKRHKTTLRFGAEYDLGPLDTLFVHAGLEHIQQFGRLQLITGAKIIDVLTTKSSHLKEGMLGVGGFGVRIPLGESKKWSLDFDGQMTTQGDKTAKFGISRTF